MGSDDRDPNDKSWHDLQRMTEADSHREDSYSYSTYLPLIVAPKQPRVVLSAEPHTQRIFTDLLSTISVEVLLKEVDSCLPPWVRSAHFTFTGGGFHVQLRTLRKVEDDDLALLQKRLRESLDYPMAVKIINEFSGTGVSEGAGSTSLQGKLVLIEPRGDHPNHIVDQDALVVHQHQDEPEENERRTLIRSKSKLNQMRFNQALEGTLPAGTTLWKVSFYQMQRGVGALQFVLLRMSVPDDLEQEVLAWAKELEQKHHIGVIVQRERVSQGIARQLTLIADERGLVRNATDIEVLIHNIYGKAPTAAQLQLAKGGPHKGSYEDLTDIPFITIDPSGARDLDDVLWAERRSNSTWRLMVGFADVTDGIPLGSPLDLYARRIGFSLYGRTRSLPLLGEDFGFERLSLLPGRPRFAWTVELTVKSDGEILEQRFFRALVCSRAQLSFEEALSIPTSNSQLADSISALREVTRALRGQRLERAGFIKYKSEGASYVLVEESMLVAKRVIAAIFEESKVPILFKVHAPPGKFQRKRFIREVKNLGLRVATKDFTNPLRFSSLLQELQRLREMKLFYRILDAYLKRARYDIENRGHHGLGLDAYTEIKGLRNYVGLLNQHQAAHLLCGGPAVGLEELKQHQASVNRKRRIYHDNSIRLLTYEALQERLTHVGNIFIGRATAIHPEGVLVEVPGFRSTGLIPAGGLAEMPDPGERFEFGAPIVTSLEGYDPLSRRYIFRLVRDETKE